MKPAHTYNRSGQNWLANERLQQLAKLWITLRSGSAPVRTEDDFFQELIAFIGRWSPKLRGIEFDEGLLKEIRQDAAILLYQGHLTGNRLLAAATAKNSTKRVEQALLSSIRSALRIVVARKLTECACQNNADKKIEEELTEQMGGEFSAPAPPDDFREIALAALLKALAENRIDRVDGEIIRLQLEDGLNQTEAGRRLSISRQAASQREARAIPVLRRIVEKLEGRNR